MTRSAVIAVLVGALVLVGCQPRDGAESTAETTPSGELSTGTPPATPTTSPGPALGPDEFAAACLTGQESASTSTLDADLCVGPLGDRMHTIRPDIDVGIGPAASPDGTLIAFIDDGELHVIDVTGHNEQTLEVRGSWPAWLPDGRVVAYLAPDQRSVETIPLDGGTPASLVPASTLDDHGPGWRIDTFDVSPDGTQIALALFRGEADAVKSTLAFFDIDEGSAELIAPDGTAPVMDPAFSPDGRLVAYVIDGWVNTWDIAAEATTDLSPRGWRAGAPAWTHDGMEVIHSAVGDDIRSAVCRLTRRSRRRLSCGAELSGEAALVATKTDAREEARVLVEAGPVFEDFPALVHQPFPTHRATTAASDGSQPPATFGEYAPMGSRRVDPGDRRASATIVK